MKKILGYLLLLIVAAFVSATTSYFVSRFSPKKSLATSGLTNAQTWIHEAKLSADQLEQLEPIEATLKRDLDSLQIVLARERLQVCTLIKDTQPNQEQLQVHIARITQMEAAQQDLIIKHLLTLKNIFTPDQKDEFFTLMMSDICTGCRHSACKPGTPCMCGHCAMDTKSGA